MTKKQNFFVGLSDPVRIRRNLLNSSKEIIDSLKRYERYEIIKQTKHEYITELKKVLDELVVLNKKVRIHLPKEHIAQEHVQKKPKIARLRKPRDTGSSQTKLAELESELAKIEGKLGALE